MSSEILDFPAGSMLKIHRHDGAAYDLYGDRQPTTRSHNIGPCSIVSTHGKVNWQQGDAYWVGTVDIQAPPDADIRHNDRVETPNGAIGVVINPPTKPVNPFTGWTPFIQFTIATEGYTPEGHNA